MNRAEKLYGSRLAKRVFLGRFLLGSVPARMVQFTRRSPRFAHIIQDLFSGKQPYSGLKKRLLRNLNGSLYDIGFDLPETHAIRKEKTMYYAFYAPTWKGNVELRGLEPRQYHVKDYAEGKDFGVVQGPVAHVPAEFSKHLLLEADPI